MKDTSKANERDTVGKIATPEATVTLVHFAEPDYWRGYVMLSVGDHDVEVGKWRSMSFVDEDRPAGFEVSWHRGAVYATTDGILESAVDHAIGALMEYWYG
jgi:hypothetical protein